MGSAVLASVDSVAVNDALVRVWLSRFAGSGPLRPLGNDGRPTPVASYRD